MFKIYVLFAIFSFSLFSQTNAKFVYGIAAVEDSASKLNDMMESMNPNYKSTLANLNFNLISNKNDIACFAFQGDKNNYDSSVKMFLSLSGYNSIIKQIGDSIVKEQKFEQFNKVYNIKEPIEKNWQISTESKEIMGYLCLKATCLNTVTNSAGTFQNQIIAWFCPKLPYQFGPMGYGGLPGLIFELQTKRAIFGLKKIELDSKEPICEINFNNENITSKKLDEEITRLHELKVQLMKK
jgi:GLPGLI family protein